MTNTSDQIYPYITNGTFRAVAYVFGFILFLIIILLNIRGAYLPPAFYVSMGLIFTLLVWVRFFIGNSAVSFENGNLVVKLGFKKTIPLSGITGLVRQTTHLSYVYRGGQNQINTLIVEYNQNGKTKKIDIRTRAIQNGEEIERKLEELTGLKVKKAVIKV